MNPIDLLPPGFSYKGLYCFYDENKQQHHYSYCPLEIIINNVNEKPDVSLTLSDEGARFSWGSELFSPDEQQLQALKNEAANYFDVSPNEITLTPVDPVSQIALNVGDGTQWYERLDIDQTKGQTEILTSTEKPHALSALNGNSDYLQLEYDYNLTLQTHLRWNFQQDINPLLREIVRAGANASKQDCAAYIEQAIEDGDLSIDKTQLNQPSPTLQQQVSAEFCSMLTDIAFKYVDGVDDIYDLPNPCDQSLDYGKGEPRQYPLILTSDISTWLEGFNAGDFVHHTNTPIPNPDRPAPDQPTEKTLTVSVNFKPVDFQIGSIELTWGDDEVKMPWDFAATQVTSKTRGPLKVVVSYYFGGKYTVELPYTGEDWVIAPEDAGLCQITLDATALADQNKKVTGSVAYHPQGGGRRYTENFTFPDNGQWQTQWYVTTLNSGIAGYLDGSYTTTPKRWGGSKTHQINRTSDTHLVLK